MKIAYLCRKHAQTPFKSSSLSLTIDINEDYSVTPPVTVVLPTGFQNGQDVCETIGLINDNNFEGDHTFTVQIMPPVAPTGVNINVDPALASITLQDNDGECVEQPLLVHLILWAVSSLGSVFFNAVHSSKPSSSDATVTLTMPAYAGTEGNINFDNVVCVQANLPGTGGIFEANLVVTLAASDGSASESTINYYNNVS